MMPAIGSVTALPGQGKVGVLVSARPIGEPENGRQLVALRIREDERAENPRGGRTPADAPAKVAPDSAPRAEGAERASTSLAARLPTELSAAEKAALTQLQQRDQQVRQEEKAHAAVAGDLAGPINYTYQRGPDGRQYAVGGSVGIQASVLSGDPAEAARKAGRLAAAANAATNPSAQDYAAARQAYALGSSLGEAPPANEGSNGLRLTL